MKKLFALLMIAASFSMFACNDKAEEVIDESIQTVELDDQLNHSEMDFPDKRFPKPGTTY